jgi:succinate dehydrogenase / fumarate reductase membrane anchor subunit
MKNFQYRGSSDNGTLSWLLQRLTAFVLFFIIFLHIFHRDYEKAMYSVSFVKGAEWGLMRAPLAILLGFGLFHAFNGFKMISDDYIKSDKWRAFLLLIYWTLGVVLFILGISVIANIEKFIKGV